MLFKKLVAFLALFSTFSCTVGHLSLPGFAASPLDADDIQEKKLTIENGLRPSVRFEGEEPETFSIFERMAFYNTPGLSVALINEGKIEWVGAYGNRQTGLPSPVTPETLFQAGSLAKPVTVAGAFRLREQGLIDFSANIQTYLKTYKIPPGAQTKEKPVTMGNLLAHTSGATPGGFMGYSREEPFPTDIEVLTGTPPANSAPLEILSPPGQALAYSGPGYTLAEVAIEDITGKEFAAAMEELVFGPLELQNSTFAQPLTGDLECRAALGHLDDGTMVGGGWNIHPEQAAAGLWTTASDLAEFLVALHDAYRGKGTFLKSGTVAELTKEQMDGHAFGWILKGEGGTLSMRHYGGNLGYTAMMILYPETGNGAVFLTNSNQGIRGVALEMLRAISAAYGWPDFKQKVYTRASIPAEQLRPLAGVYLFEGDLRVRIDYHPDEEAISIVFPNGDDYPLVPVGERAFVYPLLGLDVAFGGEKGAETLLVYGLEGEKVDVKPE